MKTLNLCTAWLTSLFSAPQVDNWDIEMNKNVFLVDLSESERTDFGRIDFSKQSEAQRVFSAIWALESQVNNGGFVQYFGSDDGDTANFAPTALRQIGALRCASIVEQALRAVSAKPLPDSQEARQQALEATGKAANAKLDKLDEQFLAYPDNLTDLLFDFVSAHPKVFGVVK
jgi:hypothetical protein